MFSLPGSSSTVIESSGEGASLPAPPGTLLAQVLERIEARRAHAAAYVALCEAQRFVR